MLKRLTILALKRGSAFDSRAFTVTIGEKIKGTCKFFLLVLLVLGSSFGQARTSQADDPAFIGRMPQGCTVELVGVTSLPPGAARFPPAKQMHWWRPDGPLTTVVFRLPNREAKLPVVAGEKEFAFLLRVTNLPTGASRAPAGGVNSSTTLPYPWDGLPRRVVGKTKWDNPYYEAYGPHGLKVSGSPWLLAGSPSWEAVETSSLAEDADAASPGDYRSSPSAVLDRSGTNAYSGESPAYDETSSYYMWLAKRRFGPTAQSTDLVVGLSMGAWETVITRKGGRGGTATYSRDGEEWKVAFGSPMIRKVSSHPATTGKVSNRETTQVVPRPKEHSRQTTGRVTERETTQVVVKSPYETCGRWNKRLVAVADDGSEQASSVFGWQHMSDNFTAVFYNLPPSAIKELRLQLRPFYWVEFQNVSLVPGRQTVVSVISSDDPQKRLTIP